MKISRFFKSFFGIALLGICGCSGGSPQVQLVGTRIQPFVNSEGKAFQMLSVDWKNTGSAPVRVVHADIKAFDASGNMVYSAPDYTIYVTSDQAPGIAPGTTYTEPNGEGHILISETGAPVVSAEAVITRFSSNAP